MSAERSGQAIDVETLKRQLETGEPAVLMEGDSSQRIAQAG
jgi:hypothetical protein